MPTYLLPCGCGADLEVGPGNAGAVASCPRCGNAVAVPRLGELVRLRPVAAAAPAASPWTAAHACLLGGALTAVLALAGAACLATAPRPPFDAEMIRGAVAAAGDADVYRAWQALARSGVYRPSSPDEERVLQLAASARAVAAVLVAVGVAAGAVALGGWVALERARSPAG